MPWGFVAGAAITGLMASDASDDAASASDARAALAAEVSREQLDWEKEKYQDWIDTYGDLEENLADFYENLTPEFLITAGLENEAQEFATAQTRTKEVLAQRNLGGSGAEAEVLGKQEIDSAENRARIRRDAPIEAAQLQQNFLQPKIAEKMSGQRGVSAAIQSGGDRMVGVATDEYNRLQSSADQLWGSTGDIIGAGIQYYATQSGDVKSTS